VRVRATCISSFVVLGVFTICATASAAAPGVFIGRPGGVMRPHSPTVRRSPAPSAALAAPALAPVTCPALDAANKPTPSPLCNMTYHNGPVIHADTTHIIYWEPAGYSVAANYHSILERYLTDVDADSGRVSNPYAINTQYSDTTNGNITYNSTYAGARTDTAAYPARDAKCKLPGTTTMCLTETQEINELDKYIKDNNLPRGLDHLYFLVLPRKVQTCFDDFTACGPYGPGSDGSEYCAYHTDYNLGNGVTDFANQPYGADGNCNVSPSAPNNVDVDTLLNAVSHEHNEAITDPDVSGGWYDANGSGENGDKCNVNYGPSLGSTTNGTYNVLINHNPYKIQTEWSNAITGCTMTYGAVAPTALFTSAPASPKANDSVSFDGSSSHSNDAGGYLIAYDWDFGDGATANVAKPTHSYGAAGTYGVTLTVKDDAGMTAAVTHDVVVVTRPTVMAYTGDVAADYHDQATLKARLTDAATASGIASRSVTFAVAGQTCSGSTDASGNAQCTLTLSHAPGAYTATATFAGDSVYTTSTAAKPFTITREQTALSLDGPAQVANDAPATLKGTLLEDGTTAPNPAGQTVTFKLGSGATQQSCQGTVDNAGHVSCTIASVQQPNTASFTVPVSASFAGDAYYMPASASGTAKVLYYTGRSYASSITLLGLLTTTFADTGQVTTAQRGQTQRSSLVAQLTGIDLFGLTAKVTTGSGTSSAQASTTSLSLGGALTPVVAATNVSASSQSTCAGASGSSTIGTLTVGGRTIAVDNLRPNTRLDIAGLAITLNEQLPVPGADQGLTVIALDIVYPAGTRVVMSSATSDIHNCP
jgi:PKD repeat protein